MPAVTRGPAGEAAGDADVSHCSGMTRLGCSGDVFVNGRGISRQGDNNTSHLLPAGDDCVTHSAPITTGSTKVFINGKGCGRVGDALTGCTSVSQGSPNVFAG